MDQRDDYRDLDARPPRFLRFLFRRVLPVALLVFAVGAVIAFRLGYKESDRHYMTYVSIHRAETFAKISYYKKTPVGQFPAKLTDLRGPETTDDDLTDAWGKPFRYAVVPNENGELEPYVWTEKVDADGRTTIIGAKVRPDGSVVQFGLPPKDD